MNKTKKDMSTNSTIAVIQEDGSVKAIYCHWDGYPKGVGRKLIQHFNTHKLANQLVALGSLSVLGEKLNPSEGSNHSFDEPEKGVTIAYHRDRGEDFKQDHYGSLKEFIEFENFQNFDYIFEIDKWFMLKDNEFISLTEENT